MSIGLTLIFLLQSGAGVAVDDGPSHRFPAEASGKRAPISRARAAAPVAVTIGTARAQVLRGASIRFESRPSDKADAREAPLAISPHRRKGAGGTIWIEFN